MVHLLGHDPGHEGDGHGPDGHLSDEEIETPVRENLRLDLDGDDAFGAFDVRGGHQDHPSRLESQRRGRERDAVRFLSPSGLGEGLVEAGAEQFHRERLLFLGPVVQGGHQLPSDVGVHLSAVRIVRGCRGQGMVAGGPVQQQENHDRRHDRIDAQPENELFAS